MLADAISDVRKQNELLAQSGKKGEPVWKQLAGAVFSWQTALVAAISLGIVYGKEIGNWVKSLGKVKKEPDRYSENTRRLKQGSGGRRKNCSRGNDKAPSTLHGKPRYIKIYEGKK